MENASKALIMAGAVLIAILIISLSVLVFNNFSSSAKNMANLDEQEISAFNSKLTGYIGTSIAGSQVNALLQYCLSNNMNVDQTGETYKYIEVFDIDANNDILKGDGTDESYTKVQTNGKYYTVEGKYDDNGLVTYITVKLN